MINLIGEEDNKLLEYGNDQLQVLVNFYGKEVMVELGGKTYTSPPLVNEEEILAEWRIFKRALAKEKNTMMEKKKMRATFSKRCQNRDRALRIIQRDFHRDI